MSNIERIINEKKQRHLRKNSVQVAVRIRNRRPSYKKRYIAIYKKIKILDFQKNLKIHLEVDNIEAK